MFELLGEKGVHELAQYKSKTTKDLLPLDFLLAIFSDDEDHTNTHADTNTIDLTTFDDGVPNVSAVDVKVKQRFGWAVSILSEPSYHEFLRSHSNKVRVLFSLLKQFRRTHEKCVVFSQSVLTLEYLDKLLCDSNRRNRKRNHGNGNVWNFLRLDGRVVPKKRAGMYVCMYICM